jgi:hypothetical protein
MKSCISYFSLGVYYKLKLTLLLMKYARMHILKKLMKERQFILTRSTLDDYILELAKKNLVVNKPKMD